MKRDEPQIYFDRRLLSLLRQLLEEVRCSRCGLRGNNHFGADHVLEEDENDKGDTSDL